jgi:membrane dipeptidase
MLGFKNRIQQIGSIEARELHQLFPPIDLHVDTLMWARGWRYNLLRRHRPWLPRAAWVGHVDVPQLKEINAGAQLFCLSIDPFRRRGFYQLANDQIDQLVAACHDRPQDVILWRSMNDWYRARKRNAVAAIITIEGAHFLEGSIEKFRQLVRRGVRSLGLVHFRPNEAAWPNYGWGADNNRCLTDFGRQLIHECNQLGVIVDLAHLNLCGFMEACALSRQPVIVSHTGLKGVHPHPRNIDDRQLRAVAATGGVVGIMYEPRYLGGRDIEAVLRHLSWAIKIVGDEHVALGSDFDGMITPVRGLEQVSKLPNLTEAMLRIGWSTERIGRILCQNVLRVLRSVHSAQ